MSRSTIVVLLVAACGGAASLSAVRQAATNRNATEHDRARDALLLEANGASFQPVLAVVEMNQQAISTGGIVGLRPQEGLYALPDGELALMPNTCIRRGPCGCEVSREYTYLKKPEGTIVVARLTPVVHLREVHVARCSATCAAAAMPALRSAARLGVRQVSAIAFEERTYPYELVVETCDPAPAAR
ncbi:MAG: hypothetical protein IPQ07_36825 [Myxococcales bacterium]|nr:hypothetical protein [Myxococcales bacterium]